MQPPEWKGSQPQRFSGGRKHISPQDELNTHFVSSNLMPSQGIKTFQVGETPEQQFKPIVKVFPQNYVSEQKEIDLRGKKPLFLPEQKQRVRKQKGHVEGGRQSNKQIQLKGIRTVEEANRSRQKEFNVQAQMQAKLRVLGLEGQRNSLGVTSLGDKSYKYPEYAPQFFKDGGLIAGSTSFKLRPTESTLPDPNKLKSIFTKPMWSQKVKMEEKQEDWNVLNSVDDWQQTVLKEANPKWNDPETFFQRMQKTNAGTAKDAKKGAKK